jgi:catechol 2,3-dioxygenase-like lactoylglutathione lyase family enzyme
MNIERINHFVFTVKDIDETCRFYKELFDVTIEDVSPRKKILHIGQHRLTLNQRRRGADTEEKPASPGPIELGFTIRHTLDWVQDKLKTQGVPVEGLVERRGAAGKVTSIYFRDPDQNLIEVSIHG